MKKRQTITNLAEIPSHPGAAKLKQLWENAAKISKPTAAATDLLLYDRIGPDYWSGGGLTHQFVTDWLTGLPADTAAVNVRINSPGGDVFEGVGIYNALVTWQAGQEGRKINVKIDALAASIASVIAMAGDDIEIGGNAMMMIHRASTITWGNAADHEQSAQALKGIDDTIVKTYEARTGQKLDDLKAWLDNETYMTADEAVERGFADKKAALKGKPEPAPTQEPEPANQSAARLATARLLVAQMSRPVSAPANQ